jgi:hypothetical protein
MSSSADIFSIYTLLAAYLSYSSLVNGTTEIGLTPFDFIKARASKVIRVIGLSYQVLPISLTEIISENSLDNLSVSC